ncbi:haloacid dehalogenase [Halobacteriales archaeon QS_7_69_60]|nr:MAG: haloacid dehalogenase [Halobacteriales archaeon QS_7_69_60]
MPPDAVLFDIDDTLCRYRRTGDELLSVVFERTGHDPFIALEEYHDRYPEFVDDSDSVTDLRAQCFAAIAAEKGRDPAVGRRVAAVYADERDHGNVEPLPGVETALDAVGDRPLGVVTNGAPEMQSAKLEALGLDDAFDVVVHAGYDVPAKPSPEPFEAALSELSVRPERAVHVGNSLRSDVAGARAAGVRTVWLAEEADPSTVPDPGPDHAISTLAELPSVIRQ